MLPKKLYISEIDFCNIPYVHNSINPFKNCVISDEKTNNNKLDKGRCAGTKSIIRLFAH